MDPNGAVISGVGEFFGPSAYGDWKSLLMVFKEHGVGEFYHPIFSDVTQAIFRKLDATMEPRENYVAYSFEFWQHIPVVQPVYEEVGGISQSGTSVSVGSSDSNIVIDIQNALIADGESLPVYGVDGSFGAETESAVRQYQIKYGLAVDGIVGPETLSHMGINYSGVVSNASGTSSTATTYTVQPGDTIESIATRYATSWHKVAEYNMLKDPRILGAELLLP
jgi:LysM repeat protein